MKRLFCLLIALLSALSLCACAEDEADDGSGLTVGGGDCDKPYLNTFGDHDSAYGKLYDVFPDCTFEEYEDNPIDDFEFKANYYICTLSTGEKIYVYDFGTEVKAQKHASNYSADGSGYSWTGHFGKEHGMVIDYALPVHFWLCGGCVIEYGGNDDITETLTELFGEQFAGSPYEPLELDVELDTLADHLNSLWAFLVDNGLAGSMGTGEHPESSMFEFIPMTRWEITLTDGHNLYAEKYETEEQAEKHASNYSSSGTGYDYPDPSGEEGAFIGMDIDFEYPVHWWRNGAVIYSYSGLDETAAKLSEYLGEQFAGASISDVPDGGLGFSYTDYNYFGVGFSVNIDTNLDPVIITTSREFLDFTGVMGERFAVPPSEEMVETYGDSFFETRTLVVIPLFERTVSDRHTVESVVKEGNKVTVTTLNYDSGDEALDFCLMFLELDGKLAHHTEIELLRMGNSSID